MGAKNCLKISQLVANGEKEKGNVTELSLNGIVRFILNITSLNLKQNYRNEMNSKVIQCSVFVFRSTIYLSKHQNEEKVLEIMVYREVTICF